MQPNGIPGELKVEDKPAQVVAASQAELSRSIQAGVSWRAIRTIAGNLGWIEAAPCQLHASPAGCNLTFLQPLFHRQSRRGQALVKFKAISYRCLQVYCA